jgi:hypothetical protein
MSIKTAHRTLNQSLSVARHGPRARLSARVVGAYVPKLTRKAFEKYGFSAAALLTDWRSIVGADLADFAAPERLKWPRSVASRGDVEVGAEGRPGAVLVLRVEPARALDVQYKAQQILDRINVYFGYRAVTEIRIIQAPLAKPVCAPKRLASLPSISPSDAPELADIADEQLREALARLKAWLTGRSQAA